MNITLVFCECWRNNLNELCFCNRKNESKFRLWKEIGVRFERTILAKIGHQILGVQRRFVIIINIIENEKKTKNVHLYFSRYTNPKNRSFLQILSNGDVN